MQSEDARQEWIEKVLGVRVPPPRQSGSPRSKLMPVWLEARETANAQIAALAQAFRGTGHPLGLAIADRGLPGLFGRTLVQLTAALMDYDAGVASPSAAVRSGLRAALQDLIRNVAASQAIPVLEHNPFGVRVTLSDTLSTAARTLEGMIDAAER